MRISARRVVAAPSASLSRQAAPKTRAGPRRSSFVDCPRRPSRVVKVSTTVQASSAAEIVENLKSSYEIPGHVEFKEGRGGLPTVVLKHACGSSAEITLFGGCVTSWKQASGDEVLYIRPDAVFDKSKPISGGIPHCFPQFGPGKMQQHGFARNLDWEVVGSSADPQPDDRDPQIELVLVENDYTKSMWPHDFMVAYSISLHGETLKTDMRVLNKGTEEFDFTAALHTYFEVSGVENAKVNGLKGLEFFDKTVDANNPPKKTEDRDSIVFEGPVDSVYLKSTGHVTLDVGTGAAVSIDSTNWSDAVVWSPWTAMPDCYKEFVCVENAQFSEPIVLKPGQSWRAETEMKVVDL